jgi:hypothetical protein
MDEAIEEMRELAELARLCQFDLFVYLRELTDLGAGVLVANVDAEATVRTARHVVHYKLADGLKALLLTFRARNRHTDEIERSAGEGRPSLDASDAA